MLLRNGIRYRRNACNEDNGKKIRKTSCIHSRSEIDKFSHAFHEFFVKIESYPVECVQQFMKLILPAFYFILFSASVYLNWQSRIISLESQETFRRATQLYIETKEIKERLCRQSPRLHGV